MVKLVDAERLERLREFDTARIRCSAPPPVGDVGPVSAMPLRFFASSISVSHAFAHLVDFGDPVEIGGLKVESPDFSIDKLRHLVRSLE